MTENKLRINGKSFDETISLLEEFMESDDVHGELFTVLRSARDFMENLNEEIQQYRAIGAIEEFKALKEKSVVKKPLKTVVGCYKCPCCGATQMDTFFYSGYSYCHNCGQKLDWQ